LFEIEANIPKSLTIFKAISSTCHAPIDTKKKLKMQSCHGRLQHILILLKCPEVNTRKAISFFFQLMKDKAIQRFEN
jgi:hypothetical protein